MSEVTYYTSLPFTATRNGITAGEPCQCGCGTTAVMCAETLSCDEGNVGAVAFSCTDDPATGGFSHPKVIKKFGDVPDDLSDLREAMHVKIDFVSDLRNRFDWAAYQCLEAYVVLPDGKSFERSDEDERLIGVFENLRDSVDVVPPSLIKAAEELRAGVPEIFERLLVHGVREIGPDFTPTSATEFVEVLNQTIRREMPTVLPRANIFVG
jgi:hypothetical protein